MCRAKNMASAVSSVTNLGLQAVAVSEKGTTELSALNRAPQAPGKKSPLKAGF